MTLDKDLNGYILTVSILFEGQDKARYVREAHYFFDKTLPSLMGDTQLRPLTFAIIKYYVGGITSAKPTSIGATQDYIIDRAGADLVYRISEILTNIKLRWKSSFYVRIGEIVCEGPDFPMEATTQ